MSPITEELEAAGGSPTLPTPPCSAIADPIELPSTPLQSLQSSGSPLSSAPSEPTADEEGLAAGVASLAPAEVQLTVQPAADAEVAADLAGASDQEASAEELGQQLEAKLVLAHAAPPAQGVHPSPAALAQPETTEAAAEDLSPLQQLLVMCGQEVRWKASEHCLGCPYPFRLAAGTTGFDPLDGPRLLPSWLLHISCVILN
jgi:hypothetical protein